MQNPNKIFLFFFLVLAAYDSAARLPALIPYTDGKLFGYCDSLGHIIISPKWDSAGFFVDGRALVTLKLTTGEAICIINDKGGYIVPPSMHWNGLWNGKEGAELNAHDRNGRWGMVDTSGNVLVNFEYDRPLAYRSRSGFFYEPEVDKWYLVAKKDGKEGVIDDRNKVLVPFAYDHIDNSFPCARWCFQVSNGPLKTGMVDTNGTEVVKPEVYDVQDMSEYGIKDVKGVRVLPFNNTPYKDIYKIGWQTAPPVGYTLDTQYIEYYFEGDFIVFKRRYDTLFGIMNKAGKLITKKKFESVLATPGGRFIYKPSHGNSFGIMDSHCKVLLAPGYEMISAAPHGNFIFQQHGRYLWGVMDSGFNIMLKPTYQRIDFKKDTVRATRDNRYWGKPDICFKYLDNKTFRPISKWQHDTVAEKQMVEQLEWSRQLEAQLHQNQWGGCGSGGLQSPTITDFRETQVFYDATHDHISRRRGRAMPFGYADDVENIYSFEKDSLSYSVRKQVHRNPDYFSVEGRFNGSRRENKTVYYAVVDTGCNFVMPPDTAYVVEYMDLVSKTTIVRKDSLYSFLDSEYKLIFPYQSCNIVSAFRMRNDWYALGTRDTIEKTETRFFMEREEARRKFSFNSLMADSAIQSIDKRKAVEELNKILLRNGAIVAGLKDYYVIKLLLDDGRSDAPRFVLENREGRQGLVDVDGTVFSRKISFCYDEMVPVSQNIALVKNKEDAYYKLVSSDNAELLPGRSFLSVSPVVVPDCLLNGHSNLRVHNLFKAEYLDCTRKHIFYLTGEGRVFAGL